MIHHSVTHTQIRLWTDTIKWSRYSLQKSAFKLKRKVKSASLSQILYIFYEKFVWTGSGKNILQCTVISQNTVWGYWDSCNLLSLNVCVCNRPLSHLTYTGFWFHTCCEYKGIYRLWQAESNAVDQHKILCIKIFFFIA